MKGRARFTPEQAQFVLDNREKLGSYTRELHDAFAAQFGEISVGSFQNFVRRVVSGYRGAELVDYAAPAGEGYTPAQQTLPRASHPTGWEPGLDTAKGTFTVGPHHTRDVLWDQELEKLGFDPKEFEIVEPINVRTWEGFYKKPTEDGKSFTSEKVTLWYHKASIIRRREYDDRIDMAALTEIIAAQPKAPPAVTGKRGFVFVWSDAQIGKGDGDGSAGIVGRMERSLDAGIHRFTELQHLGRKLETIHLHIGADLYESTAGQYPMQTFAADLNLREQRAVARRLVLAAVTRFAKTGTKVLVTVVPGNHTENRLNGKAYTSFGDSGDVEVVEQVAEICAANPRLYGRVRFVIPREEMELTVDVHGTILGLAHGHQMKGGVEKWWKGQMIGRQPIGEADILITGHLHEVKVQRVGDRWHMQAPAIESVSNWYKHTHGSDGHPGVLTFVTADHQWSDLQIL